MAVLWASQHAIERFQERFAPGFTIGAAKRELLMLIADAARTEMRTGDGAELWRAGTSGEVMLVVKRGTTHRGQHRRGPTVVTVCHRDDFWQLGELTRLERDPDDDALPEEP